MRILLSIILLSSFHLFAQWPVGIFQNNNLVKGEIKESVIDQSGNLIVCGTFGGTLQIGDTSILSRGQVDIFIAKYSSLGKLIWVKSIGSTETEEVSSIKIDGNNEIVIAGSFPKTLNVNNSISLISKGYRDIFVLKYTSNGDLSSYASYGGTKEEFVYDITFDQRNNMYLSGGFQENATIGGYTLNADGLSDILLFKIKNSGVVDWVQNFGNNSNVAIEYGYGVEYANGKVYLLGTFYEKNAVFQDTILSGVDKSWSTFLLSVDTNGVKKNIQSLENTTINSTVSPYDIASDTQGNILICGGYQNNMKVGAINLSGSTLTKIYLAKFDNNLKCLWANSKSSSSDIGNTKITVDPNSNIYLVGSYAGALNIGCKISNSQGDGDAFYSKLDPDGNCIWQYSTSGLKYKYGKDIAYSQSDKKVYIMCLSQSTITFHDGTNLINNSTSNMMSIFSIEDKIVTGIDNEVQEYDFNKINIFPNPASEFIDISISNLKLNQTVLLYNAMNQLVLTLTIDNSPFRLNLSGFNNGLYTIHIMDDLNNIIDKRKIILSNTN